MVCAAGYPPGVRAALAALLLALALAPAAADGEARACPADPNLGRVAYVSAGASTFSTSWAEQTDWYRPPVR